MLFSDESALLDARFSLAIERLRHTGRAAFVSNTADNHLPHRSTVVDMQNVAGLNAVRGLGTVAIEAYLAAIDRVCGKRARLEKACSP